MAKSASNQNPIKNKTMMMGLIMTTNTDQDHQQQHQQRSRQHYRQEEAILVKVILCRKFLPMRSAEVIQPLRAKHNAGDETKYRRQYKLQSDHTHTHTVSWIPQSVDRPCLSICASSTPSPSPSLFSLSLSILFPPLGVDFDPNLVISAKRNAKRDHQVKPKQA